MPTVDNLDIQISASVNKANASLNTLINRLDRVSSSLMNVNSRGLSTMGSGINKLSNAMNNFSNNTKTADFSRLARNLASISNVNTAGLSRLASGISSVSASLSRLPNMSNSAQQLGVLASGIAKLGYKSADKAIQNIPQLAVAMRQLMAELSKAPRVSQNLINMTNALAALARTGASSGRAANSMSKMLNVYSASANKATKSTLSLASAIGKLYASYWVIFRAFRWIKKAIDAASDMEEVQNVVDVTFSDMANKVNKFAETSTEDLGMAGVTFKRVAGMFQSLGANMDISPKLIENANRYLNEQTNGYVEMSDSIADVSLSLTKLTADLESLYGEILNVSFEDVANDLQSIYTGTTKPMRKYGIDLTEINLKQWAMKEGLDADMESMTQAEKAMLRYQYVLAHTGHAQGDFKRNADSWANSVRILKQNLLELAGTIGVAFINMLKPLVIALNTALTHITNFVEKVVNALGVIFGWKIKRRMTPFTGEYEGASDAADDLADSTGSAADNAKKLKSNLLGIDELNVLQLDTASGTGGSGVGGVGTGGGSTADEMFELIEEEGLFESEIDTLYKLGEYVRDALIGAMEGIDWEAVYEKARGFGKGLADYLNGMLAYDGKGRTLFGSVGKTLANTLNTVIYTALAFEETFNFYQFGVNIADGINKFFENFDFKALAHSLNEWKNGLGEAIAGFLNELDWETIGQGIKDFFSELDIETMALIIGYLTIKKLGKVFFAKLAIDTIAKVFSTQLASAMGGATMAPVAGGMFAGMKGAWASLGGLAGVLTTDLATILGAGTWREIGLTIGTGVIGGIAAAFVGWNFGQWLNETITGEDIDMSFTEQMAYIGETLKSGEWLEAFKLWGEDIAVNLSALGEDIMDGLADISENVNTWAKDTFNVKKWLGYETGIEPARRYGYEVGDMMKKGMKESLSESNFINGEALAVGARIAGENVAQSYVNGFSGINSGITLALNSVGVYMAGSSDGMNAIAHGVGEGAALSFENGFSVAKTSVLNLLSTLGFNIQAKATELDASTSALGEGAIAGFNKGLIAKKGTSLEHISQYMKDVVTAMHDSALQFGSPSRKMEEFGRDTILGYNNGITRNQHRTTQIVRNYTNMIKTTFSNFVPSMTQTGAQLMQAFVQGFQSQMGLLNMALAQAQNSIQRTLTTVTATGVATTGYTVPYSNVQYQAFATGGFPEDGWFRASKGEYFGRFDDGTSYIANNNQIVDGVAAGVARGAYQAFSQAYAENTREASLLEELIVAVKQGSTIQIDGRKLVTEINERSTRNGYAF